MAEEQTSPIDRIYKDLGGEAKLGGTIYQFSTKMFNDEEYRRAAFDELGGVNDSDWMQFNNNVVDFLKKKSPVDSKGVQETQTSEGIGSGETSDGSPSYESEFISQIKEKPAEQVDRVPKGDQQVDFEEVQRQIQGQLTLPGDAYNELTKQVEQRGELESQKSLEDAAKIPLAPGETRVGHYYGRDVRVVPQKEKDNYPEKDEDGREIITDKELFDTTLDRPQAEIDRIAEAKREGNDLKELETKVKADIISMLPEDTQEEINVNNRLIEIGDSQRPEDLKEVYELQKRLGELQNKRTSEVDTKLKNLNEQVITLGRLAIDSASPAERSNAEGRLKKVQAQIKALEEERKPLFTRTRDAISELNQTEFQDERYQNMTPTEKLQRYVMLQYDKLVDAQKADKQDMFEKGVELYTFNEMLSAIGVGSSKSGDIAKLKRDIELLAPSAFLNINPGIESDDFMSRFLKEVPASFSKYADRFDTSEEQAQTFSNALFETGTSGNIDNKFKEQLQKETRERGFKDADFYATLAGNLPGLLFDLSVGTKGASLARKIGAVDDAYKSVVGFNKAFKNRHVQKMWEEATKQSVNYEFTGQIFKEKQDELNKFSGFLSGGMGYLASPLLQKLSSKLSGDIVKKGSKAIEGAAGEVLEEYGEGFGNALKAYSDSGDMEKFLKSIDEQFGTFDKNANLIIGSFVAGLGVKSAQNIGSSKFNIFDPVQAYSMATPEVQEQVNKGIEILSSKADVDDAVNMTEEHASKLEESIKQAVEDGELTEDQATEAIKQVGTVYEVAKSLDPELKEETKAAIAPLIGAKKELQAKKKQVDSSLHQSIDEEINTLDATIQEIVAKEEGLPTKQPTEKAQEGVAEVKEIVQEQEQAKETTQETQGTEPTVEGTITEEGEGTTEEGLSQEGDRPISTKPVQETKDQPDDGGEVRRELTEEEKFEAEVDAVELSKDKSGKYVYEGKISRPQFYKRLKDKKTPLTNDEIKKGQKAIVSSVKEKSNITIQEAKFLKENPLNNEIKEAWDNLSKSIRGDMGGINAGVNVPVKTIGALAKLGKAYSKVGFKKMSNVAKIYGMKLNALVDSAWRNPFGKRQPKKFSRKYNLDNMRSKLLFEDVSESAGLKADDLTQENSLDRINDAINTLEVYKQFNRRADVDAADKAINVLLANYIEIKKGGTGDISDRLNQINEERITGNNEYVIESELSSRSALKEKLVDEDIVIKLFQDAVEATGYNIEDVSNPYMQKDIGIGRLQAKKDKKRKELFGNLDRVNQFKVGKEKDSYVYKYLKKKNLKFSELSEYMQARYMHEFNARAREIKRASNVEALVKAEQELDILETRKRNDIPLKPSENKKISSLKKEIKRLSEFDVNTVNGGMTDATADKIIKKYEKNGKSKDLEIAADKWFDTVTKKALDVHLKSGAITQKTYDKLIENKKYVPLKVKDEFIEVEADSPFTRRGNEAIQSIRGTAEFSVSKRTNPLEQGLLDYEKALEYEELNKQRESLYNLIKDNPDERNFRIIPREFDNKFNSKGDLIARKDVTPDVNTNYDSILYTDKNGKGYYIKILNEPIRRNLINRPTDVSKFTKAAANAMRAFMNFKRMSLTVANIGFAPPNLTRDVEETISNSFGVDVKDFTTNLVKSYPSAMKAMFGKKGEGSADMDQYYRDMVRSGGMISFGSYIEGEKALKEMNDLMTKAEGGRWNDNLFSKAITSGFNAILEFNERMETVSRLAVFAAAKKSGMTDQQAAWASKNTGVNFNKKGSLMKKINAFYLFATAAVGGNYNSYKKLFSKTGKKFLAASVIAGVTERLMQYALMDEEEIVDESFKIDNNYFIPLSKLIDGSMDITIPKSYGLTRITRNLGMSIVDVSMGIKDPQEAAYDFVDNMFEFGNPVFGGTPNKTLSMTPEILKPVVAIKSNKGWNDKPLNPQSFNRFGRDSELVFKHREGSMSDKLAKWMSKEGLAEVSPGTIDYFTKFLFGGAPQETFNTLDELIFRDNEEIDINNIMIARRFVSDPDGVKFGRYKYALDVLEDMREGVSVSKEKQKRALDYLKQTYENGMMNDKQYDSALNAYEELK